MQKLEGRRVLVTGAASGIGLATAKQFLEVGARVALNHLPEDPYAASLINNLRDKGFDAISAPGDVSVAGGAETMTERAIEKLGGIDYLVNNAGTSATPKPIPARELDRLDNEFWHKILETNVLGPFRCAHAASLALRASRGAIVNTASIGGLDVLGSSIAYSASKAALINMTKNLARGLAPDVRVNAVAPGFVESGWTKEWPIERTKGAIDRSLLKRACQPEEIADVIFYLCTAASAITGQTVVVDAGLSLG